MYSLPDIKHLSIYLKPTKPKKTIYITVYFQNTCPHCHRLLAEDSPFMQAIQAVRSDPNIDVKLRLVDVQTYEGYLEAEILKIKYTPTVYVNNELLDPSYYFDKEALIMIFKGLKPPRKSSKGLVGKSWIKPISKVFSSFKK